MNFDALVYAGVVIFFDNGASAYRTLTCVEPEPGFLSRLNHYITGTEVPKVCLTRPEIVKRCVVCLLAYGFLICIILLIPYIRPTCRYIMGSLSKARQWIIGPRRCPHCRTDPCQVMRKSTLNQLNQHNRKIGILAERSIAMMVFNCGLEVSTLLTTELAQDDQYLERRLCQNQFEEKHMELFPVCIQKHINKFYPLPRNS